MDGGDREEAVSVHGALGCENCSFQYIYIYMNGIKNLCND